MFRDYNTYLSEIFCADFITFTELILNFTKFMEAAIWNFPDDSNDFLTVSLRLYALTPPCAVNNMYVLIQVCTKLTGASEKNGFTGMCSNVYFLQAENAIPGGRVHGIKVFCGNLYEKQRFFTGLRLPVELRWPHRPELMGSDVWIAVLRWARLFTIMKSLPLYVQSLCQILVKAWKIACLC